MERDGSKVSIHTVDNDMLSQKSNIFSSATKLSNSEFNLNFVPQHCHRPTMTSNKEYVDFSTHNSNPVVCQRCLQSFKNGTELFYMHDSKADGVGKRVCGGCRQYYLKKTEARQLENTSRSCQSNLITPSLMVLIIQVALQPPFEVCRSVQLHKK